MRSGVILAAFFASAACSGAERDVAPALPKPSVTQALSSAAVVEPTAPRRREIQLAGGTDLETTCYVVDSGLEGESVLVLAGIHGDEPAPPIAARRIVHWSIARGRLFVVPTVNPPALRSGTRHIPGAVPVDLNRQFPGAGKVDPGSGMASEIWALLEEERITWLLDLHEGWDFHRINPKSVGSSVTWVPGVRSADASLEMARSVLEGINRGEAPPRHPFVLVSPGPARSVARAVSEEHGMASLVIETTKIGQPMETRVSQHERAVRVVLTRLGMLGS